MLLTQVAIRNSTPVERPAKRLDIGDRYLLVKPNGSRCWRIKFRYAGREQLPSLGVYPDITLKQARAKRDELKQRLQAGVDPGAQHRGE